MNTQEDTGRATHTHSGACTSNHVHMTSGACMSACAHGLRRLHEYSRTPQVPAYLPVFLGVCTSSYKHDHMHTYVDTSAQLLTPCPPCLSSAGGEYFSDEQMRFRAPLLYEQYIGQYLTQEELSARTPTHQPPKPGSPGRPACPLSNLLLQSYEERELQQRLLQQQEEEEACLEEEEEEEDSDEEGEGQ